MGTTTSFPNNNQQGEQQQMKQITLYITLLVLLCTLGFTQDTMTMPDGTIMPASATGAQYNLSEKYYLVDNTYNCQTYNCLLLTNASAFGAVAFVDISSGSDGSVYAIDGVGNVWTLPMSTSSKSLWSKVTAMGSGLIAIAARSSTEVYGLYSDPACPTAYSIKRWDGATYHGLWGCIFSVSVTVDGVLVGIGTDHQMYYTLNPRVTQPTWVGVNAPSGATWGNVVGLNYLQAYGNVGTVLYEINLSNGVSTAVSGAPAISNTFHNMAATRDALYIRSSVATAKGNVYVLDFQSGAWMNVIGSVGRVGGNIEDAIFSLDGSNYPHHYLKTALHHTSTVSGHYDCGIGCPAGSIHTAIASGRFLHGINTAASHSVSGTPSTTLNANYDDTSSACDPMFGDPTGPECYISQTTTTINNQVKCSVMGMIYSAALAVPSLIKWEWAYTRVYSLLSYTGCQTDKYGVQRCSYNVDNWCANTATPDLNMHNQTVTELAGAWKYWELKARCVNFLGTGWECSHAAGPGTGGVLPPAPNCTYNP
jgi:hypothetical protein